MGSFTAKKVQSLIREAKPGRYGDGNGLYLMIPKAGAAYWMCRYTFAGKRRGMTLGKYSHLSLAEAREQVVETQRAIRNGTDPLAERKREENITISTVQELFDDWYQELEKRLKHPNIPKRVFERDIAPAIGSLTLGSVTPMDIRTIVRKVTISGRPTIANDALMYLKQLFNHGIKLGLLTYNPASAFNVNDAGGVEKSRDRALNTDELSTAFAVFRENRTSFTRDNYLACALLVVLGVRKTELTEAEWSEFDLSNAKWNLPGDRSKSGVGIAIPLPPQAIAWLEELHIRACGSLYVFPSRRSSKQPHMGKDTLNRAIAKLFGKDPGKRQQPENKMGDLTEFTVHDLRRTCRSLLAELGVPGHVAERCLNHKLKGIEGIYDRYDYYTERKQSLSKVAEIVAPIINKEIKIF
ncbi:tyrosine-type recombinase/integrase [Vreelandella sp. EE22]